MNVSRAEVERAALELPADERLEIATALFESVEREAAQPELPEWQRQLLDERIAADEAGTDPGEPWETVKRRILAGL
jgi:putative addiction module component (TIGR02574 family)